MRYLVKRALGCALFATMLISGGAFAATNYISGPDLGLDIPDDDPAGLTATLTVDDAGVVGDVAAVVVSLDHTWVGDLVVTLTAPDGTSVTLMDRPGVVDDICCGNGSDVSASLGLVFSDLIPVPAEAAGDGGCAAVGVDCGRAFGPESSLSALAGVDVSGDWTLNISDNAGADVGALNGFILVVDTGESSRAAMPMPAIALLLFAGVAGVGAMRRRRS